MVESKLLRVKYAVTNLSDSTPKVIEDAGILISGNLIRQVDTFHNIKEKADTLEEYPHHVAMPGLVNTHSHAAMTLFRGFADDLRLHDWLNNYIWPAEAKLKPDDIRVGAKLAAIEAARSGTTLFNSQYWHPAEEIKGFSEVGVKLLAGQPTLSGIAKLEYPDSLVKEFHGKWDDSVRISLNPHAPYTVTDEEYQKIHDYTLRFNEKKESDVPALMVHTHIAESKEEMKVIRDFASRSDFQINEELTTPVKYLNSLGVLDQYVISAHSIELDQEDIKTFSEKKVNVAINTESNMKLGNTIAPAKEYYDANMNVGLGTDSACSNNTLDLFGTVKATALNQKGFTGDATRVPAPQALRMATYLGAKAMGWHDTGDLKADFKADLILLNLNQPQFLPIVKANAVLSHLVYVAKGHDVSHTMVNGKWIMKDRNMTTLNLDDAIKEFTNTSNELYSRLE